MINREWAIVPTVFAAALLLLPGKGWSQGLPEGVTADVVATYEVDIPGVDRVDLVKFSMEPGATLYLAIEARGFCTGTQGMFKVLNHDLGTTTVYSAGSRWSQEKGWNITVSNPGDDLAVQWVYEIYATE